VRGGRPDADLEDVEDGEVHVRGLYLRSRICGDTAGISAKCCLPDNLVCSAEV
jgi:hypothetical protein